LSKKEEKQDDKNENFLKVETYYETLIKKEVKN